MNNDSIFDIFEKIYVVHLRSEIERRKHIETEFDRVGIVDFQFLEACSSDSIESLELQLSSRVKKFPPCFRCGAEYCACPNNVLIRKQIANWISFLNVFEDVVSSRHEFCLVCEDDVKFTDYALSVIQELIDHEEIVEARKSSEPLIIRMGYPGFDEKVHNYCGVATLSHEMIMSNSCFAFNIHYAHHILVNARKISHTSDVFFHRQAINDTVKHFTMEPPPCYDLSQSKEIYSTIHPKDLDANDSARNKFHVKKITNQIGLSNVFGGNFGDLLGPYLYEAIAFLTPKTVAVNVVAERDAIDFEHYLIAGSILKHVTRCAKLWGIGTMNPGDSELINGKLTADHVYAVRGPETLKALSNSGLINEHSCVAIGDPALLLPLVYTPKERRSYKLGLVPHHTEFEETKERFQGSEDTCVIQLGELGHFRNIESVVDQICSCETIVSSSLHGIIVAHAFYIPAAWCNFTRITKNGEMGTGTLKYMDYFGSVNLECDLAVNALSGELNIPKVSFLLPRPNVIEKLQNQLMKTCPFNVHSLTASELMFSMNDKETITRRLKLRLSRNFGHPS